MPALSLTCSRQLCLHLHPSVGLGCGLSLWRPSTAAFLPAAGNVGRRSSSFNECGIPVAGKCCHKVRLPDFLAGREPRSALVYRPVSPRGAWCFCTDCWQICCSTGCTDSPWKYRVTVWNHPDGSHAPREK